MKSTEDGFYEWAKHYIAKYPHASVVELRWTLYGHDRERECADLDAGTHPGRP